MEENSDSLSKLREAIERCKDMKKLPQAHKAINNKLEKMLKEAQEFFNGVMNRKLQVTVITVTQSESRMHTFFSRTSFAVFFL